MTSALQSLPDELNISSRLFGEIVVTLDRVVHFPDGLPGFETVNRFALLPAATSGLSWLQALDNPALIFLLVEVSSLSLESVGRMPDALAILTLPEQGSIATANLRAPVLIDRAMGIGAQIIVSDETLSTTHPVDLAELLQR